MAALCLSESDKGGNIDPDGQDGIGVAMHVDSQGKLNVAGILAVDTCGEHCLHNRVQVHKGDIDRETRHLQKTNKKE